MPTVPPAGYISLPQHFGLPFGKETLLLTAPTKKAGLCASSEAFLFKLSIVIRIKIKGYLSIIIKQEHDPQSSLGLHPLIGARES